MTIPQNPYIAGNPVGGTEAFVGRADVLREQRAFAARFDEAFEAGLGMRRWQGRAR